MAEGTRRFLVTGKVQGVFFRQSTRLEAERLHLQGFARNLADGSVEVVARGPAAALDQLAAWLHKGPRAARVESVEQTSHEQSDDPSQGFAVL